MNKLAYVPIFLFTSCIFAQGAWTKSKNEAYAQLSFNGLGYSSVYGSPDYSTERKISDNTIQLYGEYGVSDKTTIILNVPVKLMKAGAVTANSDAYFTMEGSETTLGNIAFGVKQLLYNKNWVISAQLNAEAGTATFFPSSGLRSGYDTWTLAPKINLGKSFKNFYVQNSTGVDIRFNDYSSNFKIGAEIGASPVKRLWIIGFLEFASSFKNGKVVPPDANILTALYLNDQEYLAYGLKFIYGVSDKFGILANYASAFSGNNVPKSPVLGAGIYQKF